MTDEYRKEDGLGNAMVVQNNQLASIAQAEKQGAMVKAAHTKALMVPRSFDQAREKVLATCRRPRFAELAIYAKPIGKTKVKGPSIGMAQALGQAWGNLWVDSDILFDDDTQRIVGVNVTDLEANISVGEQGIVKKIVERSYLREGQEPISKRTNSNGQVTYTVAATEDDVNTKTAATRSKLLRNCILRIIPRDLIDEAMEVCVATMEKGASDPSEFRKRWLDSFARIGVTAKMLEDYFGHTLDHLTPQEAADLPVIYNSIKNGEAKWTDYVETKRAEPEKGVFDVDSMRPGTPPPPKDAPAEPKKGRPVGSKNKPRTSQQPDEPDEGGDVAAPDPISQIMETILGIMQENGIAPSLEATIQRVLAHEFSAEKLSGIPEGKLDRALEFAQSAQFVDLLKTHDLFPIPKEG